MTNIIRGDDMDAYVLTVMTKRQRDCVSVVTFCGAVSGEVFEQLAFGRYICSVGDVPLCALV